MATNAAAIAMAMMNGGGGGSGGDVTKQYVDDHLALKADKTETKEYPIAASVSGDVISVTNSADGYVQGLTVYGRSRVSPNIYTGGDQAFETMRTVNAPLIKAGTYTISAVVTSSDTSSEVSLFAIIKDGNTIVTTSLNRGTRANGSFTLSRDWENCSFSFYASNSYNSSLGKTASWVDIQLELGSTPTPYEPYGEIISIGDSGSLTITSANSDSSKSSTATLTTGLPYCGIPVTSGETYTDEQGQKWLADTADVEGVVKRCYKITFDGSENWVLDEGSLVGASGSRRITAVISDIPVTNVITTDAVPTIICNSLTPASRNTTYADNDNTISVLVQNNANEFQMRVSGIATAADLKTYLASNPVMVVYELATPTTQELTSTEKSALLNLKTFDSTTNLSITDDPFVDVGYLLDTDNGQAVADVQTDLQEQIDEKVDEADLESALALKVDKVEGKGLSTNDYTNADKSTVDNSPIADNVSGDAVSVTNSADGYVQGLTAYGRSEVVEGEIVSIGDSGSLDITTANSDNTASTTATVTTGIPLYSVGDIKDELDEKKGVVVKRCGIVTLTGSAGETYIHNSSWGNAGCFSINNALPGAKSITGYDTIANILSNIGETTTPGALAGDEVTVGIGYGASVTLYIAVSPSITTIADLKTYLASNPVTVVYELATPTTQELTPTEKSALRGLRTFDSTTNVTITDDPFVDIGYLLNTNNGQAVADVQNELQGQIIAIPEFIASIPEMHRNIFRGKNLGNSVSAAQLAAITDGSFDDLYVGDYWTIPVTIGGVTKNINWRIADIDYYLNVGDTLLTAHHLVIVPDESLYDAQGVESQDYATSTFRSTTLGTARTAISAAFPNMVITHRVIFETPTSTTLAWSDSDVEIMRQVQVIGHNETIVGGMYNFNVDYKQFALFAVAPKYILSDNDYWLRDATVGANNNRAAIISTQGIIGENDGTIASVQYGVRPYFLLGSAE